MDRVTNGRDLNGTNYRHPTPHFSHLSPPLNPSSLHSDPFLFTSLRPLHLTATRKRLISLSSVSLEPRVSPERFNAVTVPFLVVSDSRQFLSPFPHPSFPPPPFFSVFEFARLSGLKGKHAAEQSHTICTIHLSLHGYRSWFASFRLHSLCTTDSDTLIESLDCCLVDSSGPPLG